jgi:hypothetical protein
MTKEQFATKIEEIRHFSKEIDILNDHLQAIAPGAVCEFGGHFLNDYIRLLSEMIGDTDQWISWYVFDDDFGGRKLEAGYDGSTIKITSINMLWRLIEHSKEKV